MSLMPLRKQTARGVTGPTAGAGEQTIINYPHCSTKTPKTQHRPAGALGKLLDQALAYMDYHRTLADEYRRLAEYHAGQAVAHRRILTELQALIPHNGGQHHGQS